ncbi:hypothetical protein EJB05_33459, partial [Eragrostis curvula]
MMAAGNTKGAPALVKKKPRKPYTVSRPREKWTADEHDRFVHALLIFGRDWKTIEQFVATKTATQIRSHAQKYFLKVHKLGLAAALPPPHPSRAAVVSKPPPSSCFLDDAAAAPSQQSVDWCTFSAEACWPDHKEAWFADSCLLQEDTFQIPLSPDDLRFAEVYRFVGDVFGSGTPRPVEAQLQRLHGMDPVVADTILLVLRNLQDNLCV